jgi:hypothetical protein
LTCIAQRDAYNCESIYAGVREYLAEATFRDPASHEYKSWFDIVTVDDFWNWHQLLLVPRLLGQTASYDEYAAVFSDRFSLEALKPMFDGMDLNNDGFVSWQELSRGLESTPGAQALLELPDLEARTQRLYGGAVVGSRQRLLEHNVLVSPPRMTFIRAKHRPCDLEQRSCVCERESVRAGV